MTKKPTTKPIVDISRDESWLLKCPLRVFRHSKTYTQGDVAVAIGRSTQSVRNWEMGNSIPSDDNFELLAQVMNTESVKLKQQWTDWMRLGKRTLD